MHPGIGRRSFVRRFGASVAALATAPAIGGLLASCAPAPAAPTQAPQPAGKTAAPAPKQVRQIKLALPWTPNGDSLTPYVAKKLGYWQQRGIDVDIQRGYGSGQTAKQTGLGQFDFGLADTGAIMNTVVDGLDLVSLAVYTPRSPQGLFWLKKTTITKPKDLEGKSVGYVSGAATHLMFEAFVAKENLDKSKIKTVTLSPDVEIPTLLKGEVDVIGDYITIFTSLVVDKVPFTGMMFKNYGFDTINLTFFTQAKTVKEQPELVQDFVDGAMEAQKYSYLEPDKSIDYLVELVPEVGATERDKGINKAALLMMSSLGMDPAFEQNGLGYHDPKRLANTIDIFAQNLKWKQKPNPETATTNKFVGKVKLTPAEWEKAKDIVKEYTNLGPSS